VVLHAQACAAATIAGGGRNSCRGLELLDHVELGPNWKSRKEISFWKPKIRRGRRARDREGEVLLVTPCRDHESEGSVEACVEARNSPPHDRVEAL